MRVVRGRQAGNRKAPIFPRLPFEFSISFLFIFSFATYMSTGPKCGSLLMDVADTGRILMSSISDTEY